MKNDLTLPPGVQVPPPTDDEVYAHAVERGLVVEGEDLDRRTRRGLAQEMHREAKRHAVAPPPTSGRVTSRTHHDAGDHWVVVEVSTVPKA